MHALVELHSKVFNWGLLNIFLILVQKRGNIVVLRFLHFNPSGAKIEIWLRVAEIPWNYEIYELIFDDMISFEIFKSLEICSCLDRLLVFEIAKYIYFI